MSTRLILATILMVAFNSCRSWDSSDNRFRVLERYNAPHSNYIIYIDLETGVEYIRVNNSISPIYENNGQLKCYK